MPVYEVEIDGRVYEIEGDRPPSEAEARQAVGAYSQPATEATPAGPGPIARFAEPLIEAGKGMLSLPRTVIEAAGESPMGLLAGARAVRGILEQSGEQLSQAREAFGQGDYGEAAGRTLAAVPVVGPAGAQMGEALQEGNVAGALGQAVVNLAPGAPGLVKPTSIAGLLRNRAAARILDVMRPSLSRVATAEEIAPAVASGIAGREAAGGIGVGSLKTLSARAKERAGAAGREVEALQALDMPIDPSPVAAELRGRAASLETATPTQQVFTEHPALTGAYRGQAERLEDLASSFGGDVPAGELFKQRAAAGRRIGKAYETLPGVEPSAPAVAGKEYRTELSKLLHKEVPASKIADLDYRVWKNAYTNFERHRRANLTNRGLKGLKDLLAGRAVGAVMGAGAGLSTTFSPLGGVAGALAGVVLGESAYWGSLRAATYAKLARHLNAGELDAAAGIIQRTAAAYAVDKAVRERERNREAQRALQDQAEGVVTP
jgi:hypothetical protein